MLMGSMPLKRPLVIAIAILYAFATLQFIRFYTVITTFYVSLPAYLAGHERLPFQERVLPILLMKPFYHSRLFLKTFAHANGAYTPDRAPFYIISLISIVIAGIYAQKLYTRVSESGALSLLVYPVFLFTMIWTYCIHLEANYSYPYDMLSVAFFSAGLYFIYARRFLPLLLVILIGTFNRETTLFLIGVYVLDAASTDLAKPIGDLRARFSLARVPWARVALLLVIWLSIKLTLDHIFAHNSQAENYVRIGENFGRIKPRLWPALLNICGYMMPVVLLLRDKLRPLRFRNYLWIFPVWFAVMFYTGVIVETRIYGELCPLVAISLVLIVENHLQTLYTRRSGDTRRSGEEETQSELQLKHVA
jgi:hypothetical protein